MNLYKHCNLCDNLKTNLQYGIMCGLTDKKPEFNNTCSKIKLDEKIKEKIGLIHIEIESLKKDKISVYLYSFIYMSIGSIIILSQRNLFFEFNLTYSSYVTVSKSILLIIIGFGLLGTAYSKLKLYVLKTKNIKKEKNQIDTILNKYQIKYNCYVVFGEKYHGNQDVQVKFKSDSVLLKNSSITFHL